MVLPRKPNPYLPAGPWKVTARYRLQVSATKSVLCVRVRGPYAPTGNAYVLHFEVREFNRLFKPAKERA